MMAEKTSKTEAGRGSKKEPEHQNPSVWEWLIAGIGAILVVGAIGFMLYQATVQKTSPPDFLFKINSITPLQNGYLVKFEVENTGTETAAEVNIEGELKNGTEIIEKSSVKLNYVASHSRSQAGLYFQKNPQEFTLRLRVSGYAAP